MGAGAVPACDVAPASAGLAEVAAVPEADVGCALAPAGDVAPGTGGAAGVAAGSEAGEVCAVPVGAVDVVDGSVPDCSAERWVSCATDA